MGDNPVGVQVPPRAIQEISNRRVCLRDQNISNTFKKLERSKIIRYIFIILGTISWGLGIIGIFLPLLPTTPFLLFAAFCYARSSKKFYAKLLAHRWFGPYIHQWQEDRSIPLKAKIIAITMIIITIGISIIFFTPLLVVKILLTVVAVSVIVFLIYVPNR